MIETAARHMMQNKHSERQKRLPFVRVLSLPTSVSDARDGDEAHVLPEKFQK
jgi:hypothetical protein